MATGSTSVAVLSADQSGTPGSAPSGTATNTLSNFLGAVSAFKAVSTGESSLQVGSTASGVRPSTSFFSAPTIGEKPQKKEEKDFKMAASSGGSPMLVKHADLEALREEMNAKTHEVQQQATADAKKFTEQNTLKLEFNIKQVGANNEQFKEQTDTSLKRMQTDVTHAKKGVSELKSTVEALELQMQKVLDNLLPDLRRDVDEARQKIDADHTWTRQQTTSIGGQLSKVTNDVASMAPSIATLEDGLGRHLKGYSSYCSEAFRGLEDLRNAEQDLRQRFTKDAGQLKSEMSKLAEEVHSNINAVGNDSNSRLQIVEDRTAQLDRRSSEIMSIPVRRVEWIIRSAGQFIREARQIPAVRCWLSPEFEASGASGLQMELQVLPTLPRAVQGGDADGEVQGPECELRFWARKGAHMVLKLYVGQQVAEYRHTFDGFSPCTMRRCQLQDGLETLSDTLHLGVELLEVFQTNDRGVAPLSSIRNGREPSSAGDDNVAPPQASLCMFNHLSPGLSNKIDLLEDQINIVQSRMVGRVEWTLQDASAMPELFPQGSHLCSPVFAAGGVEGLQLVFFPSGEAGATPCWCSLYLYYSGSAQLQCWLWVGKQRREIGHACKERPGYFGRANFAIYQGSVDRASDSLTLAIEIADTQCSGTQAAPFEPAPRIVPWPQMLAVPNAAAPPVPQLKDETEIAALALEEPSEAASPLSAPHLFEHTARLYGRPGRLAFQDVKTLPSIFTVSRPHSDDDYYRGDRPQIWNYRPKADASVIPEGYFRNCDLRTLGSNLAPLADPVFPRGDLAPLKPPHGGTPRSTSRGRREYETISPQKSTLPLTKPLQPPENLVKRAQIRRKPEPLPLDPPRPRTAPGGSSAGPGAPGAKSPRALGPQSAATSAAGAASDPSAESVAAKESASNATQVSNSSPASPAASVVESPPRPERKSEVGFAPEIEQLVPAL